MSADSLNISLLRPFIPQLWRILALIGVAITLVMLGLAEEAAVTHAAKRPGGNAVTHWNTVAADAFTPSQGTNPMVQSRTFAILHAAMHDALNAIDRRFEAYTPGLHEHQRLRWTRQSLPRRATSWSRSSPTRPGRWKRRMSAALAAVSSGPAKTAGIAIGHAAAAANIARRQGDGFEKATQPELRSSARSSGVSVHATVHVRRATRLGTR